MEDDANAGRGPSLSTEQMLQLILSRLERFPAERLVRMETELQQLKSFLEEESRDRKVLGEEVHNLLRELQDSIDKRMDREFASCREDRDLRLTHLTDRIDTIRGQAQAERSGNTRLRIAVLGAISALVVSIVNAVINLFARK